MGSLRGCAAELPMHTNRASAAARAARAAIRASSPPAEVWRGATLRWDAGHTSPRCPRCRRRSCGRLVYRV